MGPFAGPVHSTRDGTLRCRRREPPIPPLARHGSLQDIPIAGVDRLKGFPETMLQTCPRHGCSDRWRSRDPMHLIRHSMTACSWKDRKARPSGRKSTDCFLGHLIPRAGCSHRPGAPVSSSRSVRPFPAVWSEDAIFGSVADPSSPRSRGLESCASIRRSCRGPALAGDRPQRYCQAPSQVPARVGDAAPASCQRSVSAAAPRSICVPRQDPPLQRWCGKKIKWTDCRPVASHGRVGWLYTPCGM